MRAFTDPKRPPVGETTFLVEDYVPDRLEFDLASPAKSISRTTPAEVTVDGRYLYGAPAAELDLEGEMVIAPANERPGFAGYQFGLSDEEVEASRQPLEDLPQTDDNGKARFSLHARQAAGHHPSAGGAGDRAHGRSRRPRGRAQAHAAGDAGDP